MDAYSLSKTKDLIISFVKARGPSLPVHIARDVKTSPLFAAAFLSELYREQKLFMSHLKVGSSSLYLLPGQEQLLENFIQYLNHKEQEAFQLLKQQKVLEDSQLQPAIRVAIREIQDFAIPLKVKTVDAEKVYWRYAFTPESEVEALLTGKKPAKSTENLATKEEKKEEKEQKQEQFLEKAPEEPTEQKAIKKARKKAKLPDLLFSKNLKDYLTAKDIEILHIIEEKKKEVYAKIRVNDLFGKQEYYLIAKDRKKIKEEDLTHVLHKAQQEKMLALCMAPGDLDIKAQAMLKEYRNLIKFEKVKF